METEKADSDQALWSRIVIGDGERFGILMDRCLNRVLGRGVVKPELRLPESRRGNLISPNRDVFVPLAVLHEKKSGLTVNGFDLLQINKRYKQLVVKTPTRGGCNDLE